METMMMMPPMVGTPFLAVPNGSMVSSRCVSEMFLRFMNLMNLSPNQADMISASISASSARNEMYPHTWEPGIPNCSKNLKR